MVIIRAIEEEDSEQFLALCRQLDAETQFMMLEPGERRTTVADQRMRIQTILATDNHTILVAEENGELAGYVAGQGGAFRRNRHSVHVVIGVRQAFAGQGVGTKLLTALEQWAHAHGVHRLELTVMAHNERAVGLYQKLGFIVEGTKRHSLRVDGAYVDEYYMAKLLSSPARLSPPPA